MQRGTAAARQRCEAAPGWRRLHPGGCGCQGGQGCTQGSWPAQTAPGRPVASMRCQALQHLSNSVKRGPLHLPYAVLRCPPLRRAASVQNTGWAPSALWPSPCPMLHRTTLCLLCPTCSIGAEYLVGTKRFVGLHHAEAPLIVFINAKSGGRVGPRLATVLFHALGQGQVCVRGGEGAWSRAWPLCFSRAGPGPGVRWLGGWFSDEDRAGRGERCVVEVSEGLMSNNENCKSWSPALPRLFLPLNAPARCLTWRTAAPPPCCPSCGRISRRGRRRVMKRRGPSAGEKPSAIRR